MTHQPDKPFVFVSSMLGRPVTGPDGRRIGRLTDLVASTGEPYPPITGLLIRLSGGEERVAPVTAAVVTASLTRQPFPVDPASLRPFEIAAADFRVRDLLLDQQIVDLEGAKVERVNDVQLLVTDRMWIVHVDVGFTGLLRRLGWEAALRPAFRRFGRRLQDELISWKFVQPLAESDHTPSGAPIRLKVERARIHELHPGEVADLLEELGREEREMILRSLGTEAAVDALEEAEEEVQAAVISQLHPEEAADILEEMDPAEAADILTSLPELHTEEIIAEVEEEERAQLEQLIAYEEKTAAALMTPEYIAIRPDHTVSEALEEVRRLADEIEGIYYVYVIEEGRLAGVTTLRTLFRQPPERRIGEVMETRLITVSPEGELREVAELFQKYSLLACPVVDDESRLLGVILLKHAFDELLPEFRREAHA